MPDLAAVEQAGWHEANGAARCSERLPLDDAGGTIPRPRRRLWGCRRGRSMHWCGDSGPQAACLPPCCRESRTAAGGGAVWPPPSRQSSAPSSGRSGSTGNSRCLVAMEACASSHYWAREIGALGHEVKLIAPAYVKPFVKRQKTDAALRRLLIIGATAVVQWAVRKGAPAGSWLARMLARKPRMLVAVALANRMARVAWALMTRGGVYRASVAAT